MRNQYGALLEIPSWVRQLMAEAEQAGIYSTGIESNRRNTRGTAVNADCYGYNADQHLAVIQVRECRFRTGRFHRVRKDYYLLGRTEDEEVFAHPIESPARSKRAMEEPEATVRWVLARIWDCDESDLPDIIRQGDVAFVPAHLPPHAELLPAEPDGTSHLTIRGTHLITAESIYRLNGTFYTVRKARMVHTKGEHAPVRANGCYRIQPGLRASVWGFTAPRGD